MKKRIIFALILFLPFWAFADSDVKITSFNFTGTRTRTAEICGSVSNVTNFPVVVKITVDPESKSPGSYFFTVYEENFCALIATFNGKAEANILKK